MIAGPICEGWHERGGLNGGVGDWIDKVWNVKDMQWKVVAA